jgi:general secretion pathway protein H
LSRATLAVEGGFTLIEVMVVVVIIAVLSAMLVFMAMPGDAELADKEARRLAALLELASAETRASGESIAWSSEGDGYSFWQRSYDGEWTRFPETSIFRQRSFGGRAELRAVFVDARLLPQGDRITMSPYGTRGLIEATIAGGNAQITLRGGILGRISLQRGSDAKIDNGRSMAGPRLYAG